MMPSQKEEHGVHMAVDEKHQIIADDIMFDSIGDTTGAFYLLA
ncbi:hypothetical protein [Legionella cincinnatiensis]|nr:hypothetical protein [Legionella cincinnatiensis]